MVGVAGGSRGCANCKKRKIKCDETFPVCLRCVKSGRECSGPLNGPLFRKQRVGVRGKTFISSVVSMSTVSVGNDPDSVRPLYWCVDGESQINFASCDSISRSCPPDLQSSCIPRTLMPFPEFDVYQHCLKLFVDRHLITGHPSRFGNLLPNVSSWVEMLPALVLSNSPSSTTFASRALVFSNCSLIYRDLDIGLIGANWYIEALKYQKELIKLINAGKHGQARPKTVPECGVDNTVPAEDECDSALSSCGSAMGSKISSFFQDLTPWACTDTPAILKPIKNTTLLPENSSAPLVLPVGISDISVSSMRGNMMSYEDDSITASLLLTIYEVFNCTTDTSWKSMHAGASELMRARGPDAYRTGHNSVLFQSLRAIMAVLAMAIRRDSFLNSPEWKTVPWEDIPFGKTILNKLVDLVLEVPQYEEVVERVFIGAFVSDEVSPIPRNRYTKPMTRLRNDCNTREVWELLRETHMKLTDLECRLEMCFKQYSDGAREYTHTQLQLPLFVTFDSGTATPNILQSRCPATMSEAEYVATHFFKPVVNYVTVHDARLVLSYSATRMIIAYLQQLTVRFAYGEFEDSAAASSGESCSGLEAYVESKDKCLSDLARITCRSWSYLREHSSSLITTLSILYPLRIAHSVIKDNLERGWILNELRRIDNMGIRLSLADLNGPHEEEYTSEWKAFMSLEVCQGCEEHIRPVRH
ncbi:hypothetical protein V1509DRAFT_343643 [Lipomyces kononenkoae]